MNCGVTLTFQMTRPRFRPQLDRPVAASSTVDIEENPSRAGTRRCGRRCLPFSIFVGRFKSVTGLRFAIGR